MLRPSLLDRLADEERVITWRLGEEKARLFSILDDDEWGAFEKLFDSEARSSQKLVQEDLEPFSRLDREQMDLLKQVVKLEQSRLFEKREQRVTSLEQLKENVIRDLGWLLNTEFLEAVCSLEAYPNVKMSVLNYGIRSITGLTLSDMTDSMRDGLAKMLKEAIVRFEPRLTPESLKIRVHSDREDMSSRSLTFEIEAELAVEPAPLYLLLTSVVDLGNGHATLSEQIS